MKYKIKYFDVEKAQLIIEFNEMLTVAQDLPLDKDNNIPIKKELHKYIKGLIPIWVLERMTKLKKGLKKEQVDYIQKLIDKEIDAS